jgi:ABC-2 type transport system permease protein
MTGVLARLVLRRIQLRTSLWALGLLALTVSTVTGYATVYPDPAVRAGLTESVRGNPSFRALLGTPYDLSDAGGYTAWRVGVFLGLLAALYAGLTVVALTRGDEEAGLRELIWAGAVRRQAPLLVAAAWIGVGCLLLGGVVTCTLIGMGARGTGAILLGAAVAVTGWFFTAVGALAAQVAAARRPASALVGTVLGVAYLIRMAADATDGRAWLNWLSPLGWLERTQAYAGNDPAPLLLPAVLGVAVFAVAWALEGRRDLGAGLLRYGRGPARGPLLRTPEALAARLYRGTVLGWATGVGIAAAVVAGIAADVATFAGDDPNTAQLIARLGGSGDLARSYLGGTFRFLGVLVVVVAVQGVLAARREEAQGLAEPVLARPVRRPRWLGSHLVAALAGAVLVAGAAGVAGALAAGARPGGDVGDPLDAAANMLPAAVFFAGLACLLVAAVPEWAPRLGLGLPVVAFGLEYFGRLAQLPDSVLAVSPFHYVTAVPAEAVDVAGAVTLVAAGIVLAGLGLLRMRSRELVPA